MENSTTMSALAAADYSLRLRNPWEEFIIGGGGTEFFLADWADKIRWRRPNSAVSGSSSGCSAQEFDGALGNALSMAATLQ